MECSRVQGHEAGKPSSFLLPQLHELGGVNVESIEWYVVSLNLEGGNNLPATKRAETGGVIAAADPCNVNLLFEYSALRSDAELGDHMKVSSNSLSNDLGVDVFNRWPWTSFLMMSNVRVTGDHGEVRKERSDRADALGRPCSLAC
jgi:hypothetical protein